MGTPLQLELAWQDEEALRQALEAHSELSITLVLTDNTSSMITFRPRGRRYELRLHRMFLHAGPPVVKALGQWLASGRRRRAGALVDAFIEENKHQIRNVAPRRTRLRTVGSVHDLQRIFEEVNVEHFEGAIDSAITWGKMPSRRPRRSIRFGSYTHEDNLIRLHPLLDQDFVPEFIVRYVVFHEMLHAKLGIEESPNGRRLVHTPEFNRQERLYPDFARACKWLDNPRNLRRLLARRPT